MKKVMGVLVAVMMVVPNVWAVDYTTDGRVDLTTAGYDGPGVTLAEVSAVGVGVALVQTVGSPIGALAAVSAGVIVWGAWRTDKYRDQSVKDRISFNLEEQSKEPVAGSIQEMIQ